MSPYRKEEHMHYYKVIYDNNVIDVLNTLEYVKYQSKHGILLLCNENEAEGILSSDKMSAYHLTTLKPFDCNNYKTVDIKEITEYEYSHLKQLHCMTISEIIDQYTLSLIESGVI